MKAIFRCDASIQIGTGHVMRCLTLADALKSEGVESQFICREHTGHLLELIGQRGYQSHCLPYINQVQPIDEGVLDHVNWLGATQEEDAQRCIELLQTIQPDWLIVDHYALDSFWESAMRSYCQKIMAIDDLADRQHDCDILLDQTFGRDKQDYVVWVPKHCLLLCGTNYALLRPEFLKWREYSLDRRKSGHLDHLLINLGGVDKDNITTQILKGLQKSFLPEQCRITVVMGSTAPWIQSVENQAASMAWQTEVKTGVSNMAELMANSDLAIGAAGSTSWERCCLGVPTIMIVLAENQQQIAKNLKQANAVYLIETYSNLELSIQKSVDYFVAKKFILMEMSYNASCILNGCGSNLVIKNMVK